MPIENYTGECVVLMGSIRDYNHAFGVFQKRHDAGGPLYIKSILLAHCIAHLTEIASGHRLYDDPDWYEGRGGKQALAVDFRTISTHLREYRLESMRMSDIDPKIEVILDGLEPSLERLAGILQRIPEPIPPTPAPPPTPRPDPNVVYPKIESSGCCDCCKKCCSVM